MRFDTPVRCCDTGYGLPAPRFYKDDQCSHIPDRVHSHANSAARSERPFPSRYGHSQKGVAALSVQPPSPSSGWSERPFLSVSVLVCGPPLLVALSNVPLLPSPFPIPTFAGGHSANGFVLASIGPARRSPPRFQKRSGDSHALRSPSEERQGGLPALSDSSGPIQEIDPSLPQPAYLPFPPDSSMNDKKCAGLPVQIAVY